MSTKKKKKKYCFFISLRDRRFLILDDAITSPTCSTSLVNGHGYNMDDSAITASSEFLASNRPNYFGCLAFNTRHIDEDDTGDFKAWCAG